jgi:hypothetical protein
MLLGSNTGGIPGSALDETLRALAAAKAMVPAKAVNFFEKHITHS